MTSPLPQAPSANVLLQLAAGVYLQPAAAFPPDILDRLGGEPGDVVLSQHRSRHAAQRISADAAALIRHFAEPTRILDALVEFALERNEDPADLLPLALPLIKRLRAQRLLLPPEDVRPASVEPRFRPGDVVSAGAVGEVRITAAISADTETEIYNGALADGRRVALKWVPESAPAFVRTGLDREHGVLAALEKAGFGHAPRRIATATDADAPNQPATMLFIEWIAGEDGYDLARDPTLDLADRSRLAGGLIAAYARLHGLGWLHGDVHPGNVLGSADVISLIDFGGSIRIDDPSPPVRAGLLTDYEPEAARSLLAGLALPPPSPKGEQYAVAAIALRLLTGAPSHRLPLEAQAAIAIIAETPARRLGDTGIIWPELDAVLGRALALDPNDRFPNMAAFSSAFEAALRSGPPTGPPPSVLSARDDPLEDLLAFAGVESPLAERGLRRGPRAPIYHGAAGLAFAFLAAAEATGSAAALTAADHWIEAAVSAVGDPEAGVEPDPHAFDARDLGVPDGELDPFSFFHGAAGVYAVRSRVRAAYADFAEAASAAAKAVTALGLALPAPDDPRRALDLLNGLASQLAGLAFLSNGLNRLGAMPDTLLADLETAARPRAEVLAAVIADWFDEPTGLLAPEARYLGVAHGSGGALMALLRVAECLPGALPAAIDIPALADRQSSFCLIQDGRAAFPIDRRGGRSWAGWCHGSAGHLLLWVAMVRKFARTADLARAEALADDVAARALEGGPTLCCGTAGAVFALQAIEALDGGGGRRTAALQSDLRPRLAGHRPDLLLPHSIWRGHPGLHLARLALQEPGTLPMPFLA